MLIYQLQMIQIKMNPARQIWWRLSNNRRCLTPVCLLLRLRLVLAHTLPKTKAGGMLTPNIAHFSNPLWQTRLICSTHGILQTLVLARLVVDKQPHLFTARPRNLNFQRSTQSQNVASNLLPLSHRFSGTRNTSLQPSPR